MPVLRNLFLVTSLAIAPLATGATPPIDNAALNDTTDGRNWAAYGRTFDETHFSPLAAINRETVPRLNLASTLDLDVTSNLSTPLAVDGVIYIASGNGIVHAVDAAAGKLLWRFDPEVRKPADATLRAQGVRGLAFWKGRVFVGTQDGRLIAIDAKGGKPVWSVEVMDAGAALLIPCPPRVFDDKVVVGFGAAGSGAIRGGVTAYDTATGKQLWRWPTEGGAAVSNAMTYDPEFNRLYVGTDAGGGDQRYASAIVALDGGTGEHVWHYQTTPADAGSGASQDLTMATLDSGGTSPKVLLHASANGIFHVLDRASGKVVSTGKAGIHTVYPQSFSPKTRLVYVPTLETAAQRTGTNLAAGAAPPDDGRSFLTAWDPARQRAAWQQPTPGPYGGGTLVTAGDLVFQGQADGYINAFGASDGRRLWSFYAATAALGTPITFSVGKQQYVAILTSPPEDTPAAAPSMARFGWEAGVHPRRLLVFALDGKGKLPPTPPPTFAKPPGAPAGDIAKPADTAQPATEPGPPKPPGSLESTGTPPR